MLSSQDFGVCLHQCGRNLNRAYRTCEAFGVGWLLLHECDAEVTGNLFAAKGRVQLVPAQKLPRGVGVLSLETRYHTPIWEIPWRLVRCLLIGGETAGLPRGLGCEFKARIPMLGKSSGLTVEAALAVALYERARHLSHTLTARAHVDSITPTH